MEDLYGDNCFLVALLYRDLEENRVWCLVWWTILSPNTIPLMVLLVCFLWIVLSWTIFKSPTYFQRVGWEKREKSLSSACQLTPCFSLMPSPCTWLGLVSSTFRASVALLICKTVPLLPAVRRTRPFKHNFSPTIHYNSAGPSPEMAGTNQPFSYQNALCRPLECHFLHCTKSFTPPLSSLLSKNLLEYFGPNVCLHFDI